MSTTKKATANPTALEPKHSEPKAGEPDSPAKIFVNPEELQKLLQSVAEFMSDNEEATMDDIKIIWNVSIIRGKDTQFDKFHGTSTLQSLFADRNLAMATAIAEQEFINKILIPVIGAVQDEVSRIALKNAAGVEGDLAPLT